MDDRAVSEVVGFVLVFSLVLSTVAIVYVGGFSGLEGARDHEQNANAERAFDVMANNHQDIARGKAPSRATEIKLSGATVAIKDNSNRQITTTSNGTTGTSRPRPIVYRSGDDTQIVYESGAVFRQDRGGTVMLREPDFVFAEHQTVVRYIEPRGGAQTVSGSTTILIRSERSNARNLFTETADGETAEFNVTTAPERADAWEAYLERELDWESDPCTQYSINSETAQVSCAFVTDTLYVTRARLIVNIA